MVPRFTLDSSSALCPRYPDPGVLESKGPHSPQRFLCVPSSKRGRSTKPSHTPADDHYSRSSPSLYKSPDLDLWRLSPPGWRDGKVHRLPGSTVGCPASSVWCLYSESRVSTTGRPRRRIPGGSPGSHSYPDPSELSSLRPWKSGESPSSLESLSRVPKCSTHCRRLDVTGEDLLP